LSLYFPVTERVLVSIISHSIENLTSLLIFTISDAAYCLSNTVISCVIKPENIYPLSNDDTSKYSLLRVGKESIPLIDLGKIIYGKDQKINSDSRVIVVEYSDVQFGLLVEKVKEMIAIDSEFLKTSGKFIKAEGLDYIDGTLEFEDKKFLYPNIERIIKDTGYF